MIMRRHRKKMGQVMSQKKVVLIVELNQVRFSHNLGLVTPKVKRKPKKIKDRR